MHDLTEILNWRRLSDKITLSGQPTEQQLADISELGVTHVVNLGPHHNKGALDDEAGTVASLGMEYVYIPVEFDNPTDEDFAKFCEAIERLKDTRIHVHCIYNARVSAFFYRYAKTGRGFSECETFALMEGIWRPGDDWAAFIGSDDAVRQPNRYAGEDY
ncbi:protein tyrosine phosphatase family protein [Roseibium sp. HPY-6]|uniref:protein tyrosine phosphatase family protein n=1 Tax=Roseibium sp. HPY-6 TaxID=3229852 RepID=UPI00338D84E0